MTAEAAGAMREGLGGAGILGEAGTLGGAGGGIVSGLPQDDPIYARLEDQIDWYDRKSRGAQRTFKRIKVAEILAAALIPFMTGLHFVYQPLVIGGLGVLITILEGILHLNQYAQNWTAYRSTCEALKHEKFVYLGRAGPYVNASAPRSLLAERVESLVSQEHAQWASVQQQQQTKSGGTGG